MSITVVALTDDTVSAVIGNAGSSPSVDKVCTAPVPGRNGGFDNWETALSELWKNNDLPRKNICLILPGSVGMTKVITAPKKMKEKQIAELVLHSMKVSENEDLISDYMPIGTDAEGQTQLFCAACTGAAIIPFIDLFKKLDLSLDRITVPVASQIKILSIVPELAEKTYIWLTVDGDELISVVVENGAYRYATRSRIFSEIGTVDFGSEVTKSVSGTLQFHAAERRAFEITDVYYANCDDDDFSVCLNGITGLGLNVSRFPESPSIRMPSGAKLSDWTICSGALVR